MLVKLSGYFAEYFVDSLRSASFYLTVIDFSFCFVFRRVDFEDHYRFKVPLRA